MHCIVADQADLLIARGCLVINIQLAELARQTDDISPKAARQVVPVTDN